jgi:integral membrane protein
MIAMRFLRFVSFAEGISYLLLLLVAMPLKYVWGMPVAVKWVGLAHGILFIALGVAVLLAMALAALPFKTAFVVGIASLLPAGPFFADRLLRRHLESRAADGIPTCREAPPVTGSPTHQDPRVASQSEERSCPI